MCLVYHQSICQLSAQIFANHNANVTLFYSYLDILYTYTYNNAKEITFSKQGDYQHHGGECLREQSYLY